ncbi:nuclear transport factor 2 family protein [Phenylobacterium sp. LjRoot219]|uniref:nuclear transport factor 2 family protein n=1 Tax=Phenylobacterium sp. LjRoot219 TaxID=3342283 RepID=UPI003ECFC2E6
MSEQLLQELVDHRAILELKARFVHTVDAKDWDGYRAVFTPSEGVFDFGGGFTVEGGDAFVATVAGQLENATSVHRAFLPQITFASPTEARGEWAVNDYIEFAPDPATGERRGQQGFGYEYELYRKIDGVWKIAGWRVHYIRLDPLPRAPLPDGILGGTDVLRDPAYLAAVTKPPC